MNVSRGLPAILALVVLGSACQPGDVRAGPALLREDRPAPADIREACDLAARRCSRCHPLERLELARVSSPEHWEYYVDRMRRQPASSISREDAHVIVRCLVFRSFGEAGVHAIDAKEEKR